MLTEVMQHYGLARPPIDAGFFETEHHAQVSRDIQAAITRGGLIALTAIIGSGKTVLSRRLRAELEQENKVIVSRSLSLEKAKIAMPLLLAALFYDLSTEKTVTIPNNTERRERDLQELFRRAKKPVALFVDDAHDLHPKTLVALKRLIELVAEGGGQLSIVLVGHPKLKNDLRRPKMEEIGDRATVFEFGGLRDQQRNYIDWVLKASLMDAVEPRDILTDEAATLIAAKLKTPLQIGQHLVRAFRGGVRNGHQANRRQYRRCRFVPSDQRSRTSTDPQWLRHRQPRRAVRRKAGRDPSAAPRRARSGSNTRTHGRNARRRAADIVSL
jgi:type II secretory pathway predicted ATPase ExeA